MTFPDRAEAGRQLARALQKYRGQDVVVLALPRGGVPVAVEVARELNAPLDLVLVRKIGAPGQPELALGAVVDGETPILTRNESVIDALGTRPSDFNLAYQRALHELKEREQRYFADRKSIPVQGRTVILIDDGIATGATIRAAINALRRREPAAIVLATPVAPPDTVKRLGRLVDDFVCLVQPESFRALSIYYDDFHQLSDEDVLEQLASAKARYASSRAAQ